MKLPTILSVASAVLFTSTAGAQYSTGFESPPFVSGQVSGQDLWTIDRNPDSSRVRTASEIATDLMNGGLNSSMPVHGGSQALMVSGAGLSSATVRAITGLESETKVVLDIWARPLTIGLTGNVFLTMEDATGSGTSGRAAAFRFGPSFSIDYGTNLGGVWRPSNVIWDADTWYRLTLSLDYVAKTYDFAINGTQINSAPITFYHPGTTNLVQIRLFRGADQAGMIVDDLLVTIPEPATVACLLLGGTFALVRRRR